MNTGPFCGFTPFIKWSAGCLLLSTLRWSLPAQAQVVPADTRTQVTRQDSRFVIEGGARSQDGLNQFHSFEQLNLFAQQTAEFLAAPSIQNIFSRVTSGQPSMIDGQLQVSGSQASLFLLNPAGVLFGPQARLNLAGDFAATAAAGIGFGSGWLSATGDPDYLYLTGAPQAFALQAAGEIVNLGALSVAEGRSVLLLGGAVGNAGTISAPGGQITLAAISQGLVRISQAGQLLALEVAPAPLLAELSSEAASVPLASLLTERLAHATDLIVTPDGQTQLVGAGRLAPGRAVVTNQLSVASETGGEIAVLGERVSLAAATLQALGERGGGRIYIGGDYQGQGDRPNATYTAVDRQSVLNANADLQGNGGQIIVWADRATQFSGLATASGGRDSGDGGLIELSGKNSLRFDGSFEVGAAQGRAGSVLFDPDTIEIVDGPGVGLGDLLLPEIPADTLVGGTFTVHETTLEQWSGEANLLFQANQDIIVRDMGGDATLSFQPGSGTITFVADADGNGSGNFLMEQADDRIATAGRSLTVSANTIFLGSLDTRGPGGAGAASFTAPVGTRIDGSAQAGALTFRGNALDFTGGDGSISGTSLEIVPFTAERNINLGGDLNVAGSLNLVRFDLAALAPGFSQIRVGRADSTGTITISDNITQSGIAPIADPLLITGAAGLVGPDIATDWQLTAAGRGQLTNISASAIAFEKVEALTGGAGDDRFALQESSIFQIEGGAGRNTLVAEEGANRWVITDRDAGRLNDAVTFTGIQNLTGGSQLDEVEFTSDRAAISDRFAGADGALVVTGDEINVGSLSGTGPLTLQPKTPEQSIQLGGIDRGQADTLELSTAELSALQDGFSQITIGRSDGRGAVTVVDDLTFSDPLTLQAPVGAGTIRTGSFDLIGQAEAGFTLLADGPIQVADIETQGRAVAIAANGPITAADITTRGPRAGNITLSAAGDIQMGRLNAEGSPVSGTVNIVTAGLLRATETFTAASGQLASLSTAGGSGGTITIQHGGNGQVPFEIGDSTLQGTAAAIVSPTAALSGPQRFLRSFQLSNISLLTQAPPAPEPPMAPPPSRPALPPPPSENAELAEILLTSTDSNAELHAALETAMADRFRAHLGLQVGTLAVSLEQTQRTLNQAAAKIGMNPAIVYVYFAAEQGVTSPEQPEDLLEVLLITGSGQTVRKSVGVTRAQVEAVATQFQQQMTNPFSGAKQYLSPAQQLYDWFIRPIENNLQRQSIQNLSFVLDAGLRSLPMAALHSGERFLVEDYSLGLLPTFSLTSFGLDNAFYDNIQNARVLAMGTSEFTQGSRLPAVSAEISLVSEEIWRGDGYLNESFTLENLKAQRQKNQFGILHLASHASFEPGSTSNSYIQLWDEKLRLDQMRDLGLDASEIALVVLSACHTAIGNPEAEFGFAGFAVHAGSQSALASLWAVSDEGALGLIATFYQQLQHQSARSEALRQAQLAMLNGDVRIEQGQLYGLGGQPIARLSALENSGAWDFQHPVYWSAYTMIGSPW
ncbi:MAG: CHAT domain-containing protein [Leptolyngbya sp. SIO4C1]|nr:CHAT domain-containing protein [Leptolyngbya sp. SIO4C1]